ncbi:MAG: exodeoxyribonuclease III, partial [SAR324 cluster bacterium]|nr:exodeoxyribonuclease III [SAR324 cluster bacterium]
LTEEMRNPHGMKSHYRYALKKGYAGVGIFSKNNPDRVIRKFGCPKIDDEGRFLQADFGQLSIVSLYLPSGSSGEERQQFKYSVMDLFENWLKEHRQDGRDYIICGDWNIAHKQIDLKNWKSNQKNSGFLPEEREWMTKVFDELGYVDVFRQLNQEAEQYTWWSNRGQAWAKNVGWRLDYQVASPGIAEKAIATSIFKEQRFSDHAPLIVEYDKNL